MNSFIFAKILNCVLSRLNVTLGFDRDKGKFAQAVGKIFRRKFDGPYCDATMLG